MCQRRGSPHFVPGEAAASRLTAGRSGYLRLMGRIHREWQVCTDDSPAGAQFSNASQIIWVTFHSRADVCTQKGHGSMSDRNDVVRIRLRKGARRSIDRHTLFRANPINFSQK